MRNNQSQPLLRIPAKRKLREEPRTLPPMFIARMGKDIPEPNWSVDAFVKDAPAAGHTVQVAEYVDGVHAFDVEQDTDESRKVIADAVAFVKSHLAPSEQVSAER